MIFKSRFSLLIVTVLMMITMMLVCSAEVQEVFPGETGIYSVSYEGDTPFGEYTVIVLEGTYEEGYVLDLSDMSDKNVLYYNTATADADGAVGLEFVPYIYADSTVFIGGGNLEAPVIACYAKIGEASNVSSFEIILKEDSYTVEGLGTPAVYVQYEIKAKDSFGYDSVFPDDAARQLVGYDGEDISFVENANALQLENTLPAGTYTFSVTCGDITEEASFEVKHVASEALGLTVLVNGVRVTSAEIDCINTFDGPSFEPEKLVIECATVDQYNDVMDVTYVYKLTKPDKTSDTKTTTDSVYEFVPTNELNVDDVEEYTLDISLKGISGFSRKIKITVTGVSEYTGDALSVYRSVVTAKGLLAQVESGEILLSEQSGDDIHYTKSWTTAAQVEALTAAVADAEAILAKVDAGIAGTTELSKAKSAISAAVNAFKVRTGNYAPIEVIKFENTSYRISKGRTQTIAATTVPSKPSEKPVYYSENTDVATVNAKTGAVTGKTPGFTKIYAKNTDGSILAYYDLEVYIPVTSLKYGTSSINLVAGDTYTPVLTVRPAEHSDTITYSTSDKKIATVDKDGVVTAVSEGVAFIDVTSGSGKTARLTVNVHEPSISVVSECIAKYSTQLKLPVSIDQASGISRLELTVSFNKSIMKFVEAKDLGAIGGYVETVDGGNGSVVAIWDNVTVGKTDRGDIAEFVIEVLPDVTLREYDITYKVKGYTAGGKTVVFEKASVKTTVDVGEKDTYSIVVDAGSGGSAAGTGEYYLGDEATVRAYPNGSYNFSGWYTSAGKVSSDKVYTFKVTGALELQAKFTKKDGGGGNGDSGSGPSFSIFAPAEQIKQVSNVVSNVANGVVPYGVNVVLTTETAGAYIYYTLDGSTPSAASTPYTAPIKITDKSTTISAIAVKSGMTASSVSRFTYRIEVFPDPDPVSIVLLENAAQIKYLPVSSPYIRPNDSATRYEVLEMLSYLFNVSGGTGNTKFNDVTDAYKSLVEPYAMAGIVNGYPEGNFGGHRQITRAELVKILSVMLGMDVSGATEYNVSLTDISGHWAENYIKAFVDKGYILGYPEGDFRPDRAVSRAEVVTIINRITEIQKVSGLPQYFNDMDNKFWGYDDIMNAANIPTEQAGA